MITYNAHHVTKVTITGETRFQSGGRDCISREIVIVFADGREQRIDVYAAETVDNLIVEVK